tara:strand:- start:11334 stop:15845 length:4512 start_codon:yes stop_codon:yes gene_type:complete
MLADDGPNIKGVCRSATIALRKADLARDNGDAEEQLAQLKAFARTITHVLRQHPMYARRKDDADIAVLDGKFSEVARRIEDLGGGKVSGLAPYDAGTAAAEVAASRLHAGDSSLLARRSRRNSLSLANSAASSLANSRAVSRANSRAPSRDTSPDPPARPPNHTPHYIVTDLSRRLAEMEAREKKRAEVEVEFSNRIAALTQRTESAESATQRADTRAETAERLVWELQEALEALSTLSTTGADAVVDRVNRLEQKVETRLLAVPAPSPANDLVPGRLATLEAQVLPTRVAELEQRLSELATSVVTLGTPKSTEKQTTAKEPSPPRSPGAPFSDEVRDLRQRVSRLENVDVGSAEWAHAAEAKASAALAKVDSLSVTVNQLSTTPKDDAETRAVVTALAVRVTRAEASAAAAMDLAATTSPGTARVKSAVPHLANRVTDIEVSTEVASTRTEKMVNEMREKVRQWEVTTHAAALPVTKTPGDARITPQPKADAAYITDSLESLRDARVMDQQRVTDLETSVKSAVHAMETLRDVVAAVETRHWESEEKHVNASAAVSKSVGEIITATTTAAAAVPKLHMQVKELELTQGDLLETVGQTEARVITLETDTETSSALCAKLAEKTRAMKADLAYVRKQLGEKVNAVAVKGALSTISQKINTLAKETADTMDALRSEKSEVTDNHSNSEDTKNEIAELTRLAGEALEVSKSASKTAKKAKALAETSVAAPVQAAKEQSKAMSKQLGEISDTVESLREARGMDQAVFEQLNERLTAVEYEIASTGTGTVVTDTAVTSVLTPVATPTKGTPVKRLESTSPIFSYDKGGSDGNGEHLNPRIEAVERAIAGITERLNSLVESKNEVWLPRNLAEEEGVTTDTHVPNGNGAVFGAAEAAAGAAETLAEAVERLNARVSAIENGDRASTSMSKQSGANPGAGADGPGTVATTSSDHQTTPEGVSPDEESVNDVKDGPACGENLSKKKQKQSVFASEEASAAAAVANVGGTAADLSDGDLVQRAKLAAAHARKQVRSEAARLGITLRNIGGVNRFESDVAVDSGGDFDYSKEFSARAEAANVADRTLAAELATVCALVEQEEARRESLRVALRVGEQGGEGAAGTESISEQTSEDVSVAVAARREWATCMEAQLSRLRAAAREAEARNAAAAEEGVAGGFGSFKAPSQAQKAARAASNRREASVADRLTRLAKRVDQTFAVEIDYVFSDGKDKENESRHQKVGTLNAPWGAGPGLKTNGTGKSHHGAIKSQNPSRLDSVLTSLERKVQTLIHASKTKPIGFSENVSVGLTPESRILELKSLRQMMRVVQTDVGALRTRVHEFETKVGKHSKVEKALRDVRLSDDRVSTVAAATSVIANAAVAQERAEVAEAAASRAMSTCKTLGETVTVHSADISKVKTQLDHLTRQVDVAVRTTELSADRARGQARTANASAKTAEAKTLTLAGELGRVARHVGLRGVGDALRTGVLFEPPQEQAQEDEDRFEIAEFAREYK